MKYKITDVFDVDFLQEINDNFSRAVGISSITVDEKGNAVTKPSDFCDFCFEYTRKSERGLKKCMECDRRGGEMANATKSPAIYKCHANLVDFAAPIIFDGEQIGSILGGQCLTEEPDEAFYRQKAIEYGIDPDKYVEAVKKAYVISMDRIEAAANLLYLVAGKISSMAHQKILIDQMVEEFSEGMNEISKTMEEITASSSAINKNQSELSESIKVIQKECNEISKIVSIIDDISLQTNLLGVNASIQAARAGEYGKGFSVVAEEIKNLSVTTKSNAEGIEKKIENITHNVDGTVKLANETLKSLEDQSKALENITSEMNVISDKTNEFSSKNKG